MKIYIYLTLLILFGCNIYSKENRKGGICYGDKKIEETAETSFETLNNLKDQNAKIAKLSGIFHFNFEDIAIYSKKNSNHALWIHFTDEVIRNTTELEKINGLSVEVFGILDLSRKGHGGYYLGILDSVFCIRVK